MARNSLAKVDLAEAQQLLNDGMSIELIARHFGVTRQAIYDLIRRNRLAKPGSEPQASA